MKEGVQGHAGRLAVWERVPGGAVRRECGRRDFGFPMHYMASVEIFTVLLHD